MADVGLTVIVPTIGRPGLSRTLRSVRDQVLLPGDEVLVVGDVLDGPLPEVGRLVALAGQPFAYVPHAGDRHWYGFPQVNHARRIARPGNYLLTLPDDDVFTADALDAVRRAVASLPEPAPLMFRFVSPMGFPLWDRREVAQANVSNQCFVVPNLPGRVADLRCERYESDFDWIVDTLALWPPDSLVWDETVIVHARPPLGAYPELPIGTATRLNLGCGRHKILGGWVHVDSDPAVDPDVVADVRDLPYPDGSVEEVFAGHVLEHLDWDEGQAALAEWRRVLRPGGKLGVVVPDFREIALRYLANDGTVVEWPEGVRRSARDLHLINRMWIFSYDQESPHRWCYDLKLLREALETAGFTVAAEIDRENDPRLGTGQWWQCGLEAVKPSA